MEHLFHGELKQKWWGLKAVGYHHESMIGGGEIVRITHAPNSAGVYRAQVKVDGETKTRFLHFPLRIGIEYRYLILSKKHTIIRFKSIQLDM